MDSHHTIVIADSRGRGLQEMLCERLVTGTVRVMVHCGAGAELAVLKSLSLIREEKPDLVILAAGVCDLTWRHSVTRVTSLRNKDLEGSVTQVMTALQDACELLKSVGSFPVSVATVTGIDLTDYNHPGRKRMSQEQYDIYVKTEKIMHSEQATLNEAINTINRRITAHNKGTNTPTTWTAGVVHSHFNKSTHHYYRRLTDGCHLTDSTKKGWVKQIIKTIIKSKVTSVGHTGGSGDNW